MPRLLPLLLLTAGCVPGIYDGDVPVEGEPAACDDAISVSEAWSYKIDDYGMVRGADAFDADGRTFTHTSGTYDVATRTYDVATGELLSEVREWDRWLAARDPATDTDLMFEQGDVHLVSTRTGEVRGTVTDVSPSWLWPAVALDGQGLVAMRCDDTERVSLTLYDLEGRLVSARGGLGACSPWAAGIALDLSTARQRVAYSGSALDGAAEILDTRTGDTLVLTSHDPAEAGESPMVGLIHDLALSPDGRLVATAGFDQRLLIHDAATGELLGEREVRRTGVNRDIYAQPDTRSPFAWSADGRLLARGLEDDTIVVERLCDGEILATLDIDPTLTPLYPMDGAAPATLHFGPRGDSLMAVYEGGVQAFLAP